MHSVIGRAMPSLSIYRKDEGRLGRLAASLSFRSAPCWLQAAVLLQAAHITHRVLLRGVLSAKKLGDSGALLCSLLEGARSYAILLYWY